jgi:dTDP-4-amino-4,6-dideoxygalactose transaminase
MASACAVAFLFWWSTAGAAEDELAQALREDKQLCSTPEGRNYETKFLAVLDPKAVAAIKSCTSPTNFEFDMAFKVSAEGKITRVVWTPNQPIATCAAAKLKGVSGPKPLHGPCTIYAHYRSK